MKKIIMIFSIIIAIYIAIGNIIATNNLIPKEAIRIRVIANSNSEYDQKIKYKVKELVQHNMYQLLKNESNIDNARTIITNNLNILETNIYTVLQDNEYQAPFNVNFGLNYFPSKKFKGILYKEGYYESIVVTLGEGLGDNWWCVLFPPICLIEAEESTDVEYTSMVKTIINKYF